MLWDNLPAYKVAGLEALSTARGARLLPLSPYAPDCNPIEPCWSKIKTDLQRAKARTVSALLDTINHALDTITEADMRGWFRIAAISYTDMQTALGRINVEVWRCHICFWTSTPRSKRTCWNVNHSEADSPVHPYLGDEVLMSIDTILVTGAPEFLQRHRHLFEALDEYFKAIHFLPEEPPRLLRRSYSKLAGFCMGTCRPGLYALSIACWPRVLGTSGGSRSARKKPRHGSSPPGSRQTLSCTSSACTVRFGTGAICRMRCCWTIQPILRGFGIQIGHRSVAARLLRRGSSASGEPTRRPSTSSRSVHRQSSRSWSTTVSIHTV